MKITAGTFPPPREYERNLCKHRKTSRVSQSHGLDSPLSARRLLSLGTALAARTNVLLLCVDDLRPELGCYGAAHIQSPHIDKLATQGRLFERQYVQAPTCGASRHAMLSGRYDPAHGGNEVFPGKDATSGPPFLPLLFRNEGYQTVSIGKVSHRPGGRCGAEWNDPAKEEMPGAWVKALQPAGPWKNPLGVMHGLANGETRGEKKGTTDVFQSTPGPDDIYPDGWITNEALARLDALAKDGKPFFLAVGWIKPHLPFGAPKKYLDLYTGKTFPPVAHPEKPSGPSTWHASAEVRGYNLRGRDPITDEEFADELRRHYAACVSYADAQVGRVLERLTALGLDGNTVVVLWGDHGWHLGEHAVWGKHTLFEESLRSPLIVRTPGMEQPGKHSAAVVETIDLYPTLCALAGLPVPSGLDGKSLVPVLKDPSAAGGEAVSYFGKNTTIRDDRYRLIVHHGDKFELYDHKKSLGETINIAGKEKGEVVRLLKDLRSRLARTDG